VSIRVGGFVSTSKYKSWIVVGYVTDALSHVLVPTVCMGVIIIVPGMLVRGSLYRLQESHIAKFHH